MRGGGGIFYNFLNVIEFLKLGDSGAIDQLYTMKLIRKEQTPIMLKKIRVLIAAPFILLSAFFKIISLIILPAEYRKEGKEAI